MKSGQNIAKILIVLILEVPFSPFTVYTKICCVALDGSDTSNAERLKKIDVLKLICRMLRTQICGYLATKFLIKCMMLFSTPYWVLFYEEIIFSARTQLL